MKAKIIKTGEIIDFKGSSIEFGTCTWVDSKNILCQGQMPNGGIEIIENYNIDWEQRRYEVAKTALAGINAHDGVMKIVDDVNLAIRYADEMIKQLKTKEYE